MGLLASIQKLDEQIILWINGFYTDKADFVMSFATETITWLPFFAALLYFIVVNKGRETILILLFIALALISADGISTFVKELAERLRPSHNATIMYDLHIVDAYRGGKFSFFSSHACNSFAIAAFFSLMVRNLYFGLIMYGWAAFHTYTRLYLGVHYLSDVLTGLIIGLLLGYLFYAIYIWSRNKISVLAELRFDKSSISFTPSGFKRSHIGFIFASLLINLAVLLILANQLH